MEFPRYAFKPKASSPMRFQGLGYVILPVADAGELAKAIEAGWVAEREHLLDAPPTRAELVQKAKELGIEFHHRTGDAKLAAMIEEALK